MHTHFSEQNDTINEFFIIHLTQSITAIAHSTPALTAAKENLLKDLAHHFY